MKCNQLRPGFELVSWCPFPTTITRTPCCDSHLIQFPLYLVQIPDFAKAPLIITELPLCFTLDVIQGVAAFSPNLRNTLTLLFYSKISNFYLSVQRPLFNCSIVQSLSTLAHWSLLTLFYLLNREFLTGILPYRPDSYSLLPTVNFDTFSRHWFNFAEMFGAVSLLSCKLVTLMKLSSTLLLLLVYQPYFWSVSWCLLAV